MAYQPVKLIYNSYIPTELSVGMLFAMSVTINEHSYLHLRPLRSIPKNQEEYIQHNGYPVKPYFVRAVNPNPDVPPEVVATPEQIAYYEQEHDLYDFTIDDMNYICMEYDGYIGLYMDDETNTPVLEDGKVVVTSIENLLTDEDLEDNESEVEF